MTIRYKTIKKYKVKDQNSDFSLLSNKRILKHLSSGNIVISPFKSKNLGTASYDLTLGEYYFREQIPEPGFSTYSPWSSNDIQRVWGKAQRAVHAGKYSRRTGRKLPSGIGAGDMVIWIPPGETYLCHTKEFIGGRNVVTTMMKARSSMGRNFIEVCKCAGWGDVGYINRWTMEVTNNSKYFTIPLVVGRRIAQMAFFEVGPILGKQYSGNGKYQKEDELNKIKKSWKPDDMLPKMWKDKEVGT